MSQPGPTPSPFEKPAWLGGKKRHAWAFGELHEKRAGWSPEQADAFDRAGFRLACEQWTYDRSEENLKELVVLWRSLPSQRSR